MFVRLSAAIAAVSLLSGAAMAQAAKPTDPQIAHIAYTAGVIDIAAAKQALAKTTNKDVKAFAEDMVRDHEAVNKQALDLVKKLKVTPEDNDTSKTLSKNAADKLAELGVPAITILNMKGYHHFVVIKGIAGNEILVSDPAAGTTVISRPQFESMWNGILFLIRNRKNVAVNYFNRKQDWQVRTKAPIGTAMEASELSRMTNFLARPAQ